MKRTCPVEDDQELQLAQPPAMTRVLPPPNGPVRDPIVQLAGDSVVTTTSDGDLFETQSGVVSQGVLSTMAQPSDVTTITKVPFPIVLTNPTPAPPLFETVTTTAPAAVATTKTTTTSTTTSTTTGFSAFTANPFAQFASSTTTATTTNAAPGQTTSTTGFSAFSNTNPFANFGSTNTANNNNNNNNNNITAPLTTKTGPAAPAPSVFGAFSAFGKSSDSSSSSTTTTATTIGGGFSAFSSTNPFTSFNTAAATTTTAAAAAVPIKSGDDHNSDNSNTNDNDNNNNNNKDDNGESTTTSQIDHRVAANLQKKTDLNIGEDDETKLYVVAAKIFQLQWVETAMEPATTTAIQPIFSTTGHINIPQNKDGAKDSGAEKKEDKGDNAGAAATATPTEPTTTSQPPLVKREQRYVERGQAQIHINNNPATGLSRIIARHNTKGSLIMNENISKDNTNVLAVDGERKLRITTVTMDPATSKPTVVTYLILFKTGPDATKFLETIKHVQDKLEKN